MKRPVEHYLLTISIGDLHLHGYVMTDEARQIDRVMDGMCAIAEKIAESLGQMQLPVVLITHLTTGVDVVRGIICERFDEAREALKTATNHHETVFWMKTDYPDDRRLMELH